MELCIAGEWSAGAPHPADNPLTHTRYGYDSSSIYLVDYLAIRFWLGLHFVDLFYLLSLGGLEWDY